VRKTAIAVGTSVCLCLVTALPALADSSLPQPHGGPDVLGTRATAPGGTAFTGSNVSWAMLTLGVLLVLGAASLVLLQRRRAAH
jgi:LPXTG-motif cell wall-anchored protein